MSDHNKEYTWYKVLESMDDLPEGRVMTVYAGKQGICLTHFKGQFSALNNRCPHQGGPLGEGSIENGLLRCPWHGWDYDPHTGQSPGGFDDGIQTFPIEIRDTGVYAGIRKEVPHKKTVSDLMVETMIKWGVNTVFGMVGHSNLGMADAFRKQEEKGNLHFFGIRHEGAAAFAASAYGKLTGRPAACFAIAGPGATNMITGLWDAKMDRSPVIGLAGQVNTQVLGPGAFQEVDLKAAFDAVSSFNHIVLHDSNHAELMSLALKNAIYNRNVATLIFPDEVQEMEVSDEIPPGSPEGRSPSLQISPSPEVLDDAVNLLRSSRRPVIIVGHGARFEMEPIIRLAEHLNAPVLTTFKGKGLIPDNHPLGAGVLGRSGTPIASWLMNEADTLLVFGASFSNHTGISAKLPIIQVDYDPMQLARFHSVKIPLLGEIGVTARLFIEELNTEFKAEDQRKDIADRWKIWRKEKEKRLKDDRSKGVSSAAIFDALNRHAPENAVIAVDVGNNTYSFGRYFECKNQSILMSGYLGSIGFAYPAAMGAWAASPHRPIIAISGDGGFGQYLGELTTAVKYQMPIKHILVNNSELGKISKEQRAANFNVWKTSLHNPNLSHYAENCGALGIRVLSATELDKSMEQIFSHHGPAMLEIISDAALV